jgi:hypothetical protein
VLLKNLVIPAQYAQDALPVEIVFRALFHCRVLPWCTDVSFPNSGPAAKKFWAAICQKPEIVALSEARGLA